MAQHILARKLGITNYTIYPDHDEYYYYRHGEQIKNKRKSRNNPYLMLVKNPEAFPQRLWDFLITN